jgi:stearoyl-CoA desaturase (delta-9 desaturase)
MTFSVIDFVAHGLLPLPWWGYFVVALAVTHVTIACVTIFLHRSQAHRALDLHPAVSHFFRFWLWLTTGMVTKEWVAIHRKHHAKVETRGPARHRPCSGAAPSIARRGRETIEVRPRHATTGSSANEAVFRGKASD